MHFRYQCRVAACSESALQPKAILDFCQSSYEAGANLAGWDRDALERKAAPPIVLNVGGDA